MTPFRSSSLLKLGLLTVGLSLVNPALPRAWAQEAAPVTAAVAPPVVKTSAAPVVPTEITFADQQIRLSDGGRAAVQKLVDALYRHPAYLDQKVERANTYFPIIDRILKEEGVPAEFRYLAMQESGLVSDAVSTSNAVGFWQFKKEAAADFGVKVNDQVDERRHIVESTRAAAKYFKRSNATLHNWTNSLMSYYTGLGGAKKLVKPEETDAKAMAVTETTHSYVITFLAHKVAFENRVGLASPALVLQELKAKPGQTLAELATSLSANSDEIAKYNKWLLASTVPTDKEYTVLVPVVTPTAPVLPTAVATPVAETLFPTPQLPAPEITQINGLKAVVARKGDSPEILALVTGMDIKRFRTLNDLGATDGVVEGRPYYLQKKRNKAVAEYHVVQTGESLQQVAQQYGVKAKAILKKNRLKSGDALDPGRLLWLQHTRPSSVPVEYVSTKVEKPYQPAPDAAPATASTTATPVPADVARDTAEVDDKLATLNDATTPKAATTTPTTVPAPAATPTAPTSPTPAATATTTTKTTTTTAPAATSTNPTPVVTTTTASATSTSPAPTAPATAPATPAAAPTSPAPTATAPATPNPSAPATKPVSPATAATPAPVASPAPTTATTAPATTPAATTPVTTPATTQPAQGAQGSPAPQTHTVAKGESLSAISRRYNVALKDLMTWNGMENANLKPGQTLRVSAPADATAVAPLPPTKPDLDSAGATWHTVQAGESLYRISKQYNTTVQTLMEWNSLSDFNVKLGQKLVVKK